jgi:PAS domain-containing protein
LPLGVQMDPSAAVADQILRIAVNIVRGGDHAQFLVLDLLPVAIYVTDPDGFISYFNPACIEFSGRQPVLGRDRWCVSWKLYTNEGQFLPHEQCPMARAIQTRQIVRGVAAIAERPNGSRVGFLPFPTPVLDASDELIGAINILVVVPDRLAPAARDLGHGLQTWRDVLVGHALASFTTKDLTDLIDEIEIELNRKGPRVLN